MGKSLLLFSSGLDSYILFRTGSFDYIAYYVLPTISYTSREIENIKNINTLGLNKTKINIIESDMLSIAAVHRRASGFIPYRNFIFLFLSVLLYPDVDRIYIGQILEWQVDKNKQFYRWFEHFIFLHSGRRIKIIAPFSKKTKSEVVSYFLADYSFLELIKNTYSCLQQGDIHCGTCSSCVNRYVAFKNNGIVEPMQNIPSWGKWKKYVRGNKKQFKIKQILLYIRRWLEFRKAFNK